MANKKIGFIGVGMMGHGMAKNLVEKGFPTTILGHKNRAPVEDLLKRGAKEAKDIAGLVAASDIVFICVTGSPQVEDLIYRKGGIRRVGPSGAARGGHLDQPAGFDAEDRRRTRVQGRALCRCAADPHAR